MNSINWPAPNVWVFIAQLVEHCSSNAKAMGSNPVQAPKTFFALNLRNYNCDDHFIRMSAVHIIITKCNLKCFTLHSITLFVPNTSATRPYVGNTT